MFRVRNPLVVICVFLWLGFVCAISFMEAWLKFEAPGITLPLGLGIGRLVFSALNAIEWVFAIAIVLNYVFRRIRKPNYKMIFLVIPLMILTLQTLELLPELDVRAEKVIRGEDPGLSNAHNYYVILEALKVISLFVFGTGLFISRKVRAFKVSTQTTG